MLIIQVNLTKCWPILSEILELLSMGVNKIVQQEKEILREGRNIISWLLRLKNFEVTGGRFEIFFPPTTSVMNLLTRGLRLRWEKNGIIIILQNQKHKW